MAEWASAWKLPINPDKCSVMHLGPGAAFTYKINDITLQGKQSVRDLGVFVDQNLNFSDQIHHVTKKAFAVLFATFGMSIAVIRRFGTFVQCLRLNSSRVLLPSLEPLFEKRCT